MPIYAYKCSSCGHTTDALQKMSDAPLTVCSACGQATFAKQLTAPQFQLKGSGWYVTDFRDGKKPGSDVNADAGTADTKATDGADTKPETKTDTKSDTVAAPASSTATPPTPAAAPAAAAPAVAAPAK